ncbi:O-methyltransferase, partial [uncultured Dubosiella sp.]|uniref:O-methyltransferase n=1 Tax=uncultured Dubosiella sp. TaxID=1937011 RepID=UPI00351CCCB7
YAANNNAPFAIFPSINDEYQRFFAKYSPILSRNGIILSDNMNFHGMVDHPERTNNRNTKHLLKKIRMYREFLKSLEDFETTFMDVGDGVAVTRRKKR